MLAFPNVKINLGLNVVAKRADGYHTLQSVFYPVKGLFDVLELLPATEAANIEYTDKTVKPLAVDYATVGKLQLAVTGIAIPGNADDNLLVKAYNVIDAEHNLPEAKAHLHKLVPTGAGIGGGSADGTFFIKLLNDVFKLALDDAAIQAYAAQLGSDCPFFILNNPAYVFSRGDEFEAIDLLLEGYYITIVKPPIHVSTAAAFANIIPAMPEKNVKDIVQLPIEQWKGFLANDFEASVAKQFPQITDIKEQLYTSGAIYASMSGSGSSVYGIFKEEPVLPVFPMDYFVWKGRL